MSYTFFNKTVYDKYSYLILSVFHNNIEHCGSYYKDSDGEYISSIATGKKFYNLYDFVFSIKGKDMKNENYECYFYDEITKSWIPVYYL